MQVITWPSIRPSLPPSAAQKLDLLEGVKFLKHVLTEPLGARGLILKLHIGYTWWSKLVALKVREVKEEGKGGEEEVERHTKATKQPRTKADDLAKGSVTGFPLCANGQPYVYM